MSTTLDAMVERLEDQGVGTGGETIFAGSDIDLPSAGSPALLTLAESGGFPPMRIHNSSSIRYPSIQITARGSDYQEVSTLLDEAYEALGGGDVKIVNQTIGGVFFLDIHPYTEPLQLPLDAQGRVRLSFNVASTRR